MPHTVAELDDAHLVRAVQRGDTEAFATLFRRHYPTVRRACERRVAAHEADEVAQAAFVRAYERIHHCTGDRRFGAWVQVIALRLCADVWRARTRTTPMEDPVGDGPASAANECEDALLRRERAAEVRRALDALPARQRQVIVARDVDGRRPPDIAAALAVSVSAVDSLLMRARRRMVASCRATGTEGAVTTSLSTASVAVSALADQRPLARLVGDVASSLSGVLSRVVAALGAGPAGPTVGSRLAEVVGAGALALAPLAPAAPPATPPALIVPAITVPATVVAAAPGVALPLTVPPPPAVARPAPLAVPAPHLGGPGAPATPTAPPAPPAPPAVPVAVAVGGAEDALTSAVGAVAGDGGAVTDVLALLLGAAERLGKAPPAPHPVPPGR